MTGYERSYYPEPKEVINVKKRKDPAAVSLGKKRWKGVDAATRSEALRRAVTARWAKKRKP